SGSEQRKKKSDRRCPDAHRHLSRFLLSAQQVSERVSLIVMNRSVQCGPLRMVSTTCAMGLNVLPILTRCRCDRQGLLCRPRYAGAPAASVHVDLVTGH